jgi:hypothetical protein
MTLSDKGGMHTNHSCSCCKKPNVVLKFKEQLIQRAENVHQVLCQLCAVAKKEVTYGKHTAI